MASSDDITNAAQQAWADQTNAALGDMANACENFLEAYYNHDISELSRGISGVLVASELAKHILFFQKPEG